RNSGRPPDIPPPWTSSWTHRNVMLAKRLSKQAGRTRYTCRPFAKAAAELFGRRQPIILETGRAGEQAVPAGIVFVKSLLDQNRAFLHRIESGGLRVQSHRPPRRTGLESSSIVIGLAASNNGTSTGKRFARSWKDDVADLARFCESLW